PLSLESQLESRVLMMSTNNILHPANGKPIITPSKDIVLGLYYLSMEREGELGERRAFSSLEEIEHALFQKTVSLHANITARYIYIDEEGKEVKARVETTPGRMLVWEIMPKHQGVKFEAINQLLTSTEITKLVDMIYRNCGQKEAVIFSDRLMALGFRYATVSGISFGKDDLLVPEEKKKLVADTREKIGEFQQQYMDGLITNGERFNKVTDAWTKCTEQVAEAMMKDISKIKPGEPVNSVYMMANSRARGSAAQMRQLAAMRGLIAKTSGEIIETPIISNFKEGLNVNEYFNSAHGARKGLTDTALKTANSGYLTRRLVDVAQDCIIVEVDCGTEKGLSLRAVVEGGEMITPLGDRILGRTAAIDIIDPVANKVIVPAGTMIEESHMEAIEKTSIDAVLIRSVLTCETKDGICAKCYGRDLARGTPVNLGEAVGVIAAQSIGEPGTQLTMRTFHIGGAAQVAVEQSSIEVSMEGTIHVKNRSVVKNSVGENIVMSRYSELCLVDAANQERASYKLPYGSRLLVEEGTIVKPGDKLADWDPYTLPVISEVGGVIHYVDLVEGLSVREALDETTGLTKRVVADWKQSTRGADLKPRLILRDKKGNPLLFANGAEARYFLSVDAVLEVENNATIHAGDVLARIPRESAKTRDITGGLPRVAELFEARRPKDAAVISEYDGRIEFGKDHKTKRRVMIIPDDESLQPIEYLIPKGKHISVQEGEQVKRGDIIMDGNMVPHDILRILGVEALASYLINEIQEVYRLQGVPINDKHVEVIVRQMLQKVEIINPGETTLLLGEQVDKHDFEEENKKAIAEGRKPAQAHDVLQGITKASLQTKSFFSAASFQETTRVLTEAAVSGKVDELKGLKENIIVGRLIPVGTGSIVNRMKAIAAERDRELQDEKAKKAAAITHVKQDEQLITT
ncbi:MAG TPA: DNA-directed RNA polymerase subunit beta', partial [Holosporales bacterium]|nr:DNA-directed RNA polymerase subunit beta' [Holosporales bacterium]